MTDPIPQALHELADRSVVMADLIDRHGPYEPRPTENPDVFASLARAIVYQQLAGRAAATIHERFSGLLDGDVSPQAVLAADPEALRGAGLSRAKRDAVLDLARHAQDGLLDLAALETLDDEALVRRLCRVRGVGPWTAQMFLIFQLGRLDVWPTADLGVRRGFGLAFGHPETPTAKALEPLGDEFRPYRSIVAWYCWRVADAA